MTTQKENDEAGQSVCIYSRNSVQVRRLRSLQTRSGRDATGLYLIEGVRHLAEAMKHCVRIETLVVAPKLLENPLGKKLVRQLRIRSEEHTSELQSRRD